MPLKLYFHPLSSYCWKALTALYENDTPFDPIVVDLSDPESAAAFREVWALAKFPVLVDEARGQRVAESTIVIEYLDRFYPGATRFIPEDADNAWQVRMWDRFYDNYVHERMQRIVGDKLRPAASADPYGVEQARGGLRQAYAILDAEMTGKPWAGGDSFSLADCAAMPALIYGDTVEPIAGEDRALDAYLDRLKARPSVARVLSEAEPWFKFFPMEDKPKIAPRSVAAE